ncbi:hypothetical protein MtrunA17_Chr1g0198091 [Medicago truncatula]|uniref:Uncharacterized protein n=1 Tax=Medicago truncatula TaxID=3880 RepID=A0A396JZF0_MEDTR|nr:hypothetical protein MtrunA17_Chr1g0198091 [Medicago truncatula]
MKYTESMVEIGKKVATTIRKRSIEMVEALYYLNQGTARLL